MPIEKINLSNSMVFELSIAFFRLLIDNSPHPSRSSIFFKFIVKISEGFLINCNSQNLSTTFFPSPSILKASLDTICFNFSLAIYLQS